MNLHLHQGKRLSETVRHGSLLLLEDLCYLQIETREMFAFVFMTILHYTLMT